MAVVRIFVTEYYCNTKLPALHEAVAAIIASVWAGPATANMTCDLLLTKDSTMVGVYLSIGISNERVSTRARARIDLDQRIYSENSQWMQA